MDVQRGLFVYTERCRRTLTTFCFEFVFFFSHTGMPNRQKRLAAPQSCDLVGVVGWCYRAGAGDALWDAVSEVHQARLSD
jgi:hypothetical protein